LTVTTIFCNVGMILSTAVICCHLRVRGAGIAGREAAGGQKYDIWWCRSGRIMIQAHARG
jgi:hypothetical protein